MVAAPGKLFPPILTNRDFVRLIFLCLLQPPEDERIMNRLTKNQIWIVAVLMLIAGALVGGKGPRPRSGRDGCRSTSSRSRHNADYVFAGSEECPTGSCEHLIEPCCSPGELSRTEPV
jgi:hypothetical protein